MQMGMTIKGAKQLQRVIKRTRQQQLKAVKTAIRIESFRKKALLQEELRKRRPGGRSLAPLSFLANQIKSPAARRGMPPSRRKRGRKSTMDRAIRYETRSEAPFTVALGVVASSGRSWRYFADIQQRGFIRPVSEAQRRLFVAVGAKLGTIEGGDTPFFLHKGTTAMRTPARPFIEPFYRRYRHEIVRNISRHYAAKMAGRRV